MENQFEIVRGFCASLTAGGSTQTCCHRVLLIILFVQRFAGRHPPLYRDTGLYFRSWNDPIATGQHEDFPSSCISAQPLCAGASVYRIYVGQGRCWRPIDSQSGHIGVSTSAGNRGHDSGINSHHSQGGTLRDPGISWPDCDLPGISACIFS